MTPRSTALYRDGMVVSSGRSSGRRPEKAVDGLEAAPTLDGIAALLGISRSTVSRAFSRPDLLRPDTVARVLDVAQQLGYAPNHVARALSTGRNGNIALIVPDIANPFFPPLIRAAQSSADQQDYCVFLGDSAEQPAHEDRLIARFMPQVDGFVLASSRLPASELAGYARRRPLVLINRDVPHVPRVLIDARDGVVEAMSHLSELGHRRVAYLGGPAASWSDRQRRRATEVSARRLRMRLTLLRARPATYDGAAGAAAELLASGATAAIAFDDAVAHGLLAGLGSHGVRVPEDFSIVGCDDVLAATTYPPLTTISSRCAEAGELAVRLLLEILGGRGAEAVERHTLDSHLVLRATTGPPPRRTGRS